ncbi:MAG: cation transporter, partial [Erysipelotrichaceae bacterium]|nr:cation transporter [Erysipelotrichaceae bacterium]
CGHCEATVKKALEAVEGVESAQVSHEKGQAIVTVSHEIDDSVLIKAVEDREYKVTGIE